MWTALELLKIAVNCSSLVYVSSCYCPKQFSQVFYVLFLYISYYFNILVYYFNILVYYFNILVYYFIILVYYLNILFQYINYTLYHAMIVFSVPFLLCPAFPYFALLLALAVPPCALFPPCAQRAHCTPIVHNYNNHLCSSQPATSCLARWRCRTLNLVEGMQLRRVRASYFLCTTNCSLACSQPATTTATLTVGTLLFVPRCSLQRAWHR
jgi:hypothetical protein